MPARHLLLPFLAAAVALSVPARAEAQFLKKLKDTVAGAAADEGLTQVDRLVREGVACVFDDLDCIQGAEESGEAVYLTDADGNPVVDDAGAPVADPAEAAGILGEEPPAGPVLRPGEGAWANYDFIPGNEILFVEDYSDDDVGDFPRRLEWLRGNMEIVEWEGRKLLRVTSNSQFAILVADGVPDRFTLEVEINYPHSGAGIAILTEPPPTSGDYKKPHFNFGNWRGSGLFAGSEPLSAIQDDRIRSEIVWTRIMADGRHFKAYINERRVSNAPRVELVRGEQITFVVQARDDSPVYVGEIRLAAGGRDLYDKLQAEGRVATQGILFDVNSDVIRPESTPTLEEIGEMLGERPDLKIAIEGHTDSTGDELQNLELSDRRARAVKAYLMDAYGIDDDRLTTVGLGQGQPVADNDTPEGRQQNRRVELVRR